MSHKLQGIIGPFVVGAVVSCFLTGVVSAQSFQYYVNFPNDRPMYKYCVLSILILDLTHTAISVWTVWDWCVSNYGNLQHLAVSPWSFGAGQVLLGVIALICRTFYAYRVYIVSKRKLLLPIIIMILSLASLGCALGAAITVFTKKYFSKFAEFTWGISTWLAIATVADAVITGSLVYYLAKSKSGGLHSTNSIINKLIELLVSTNGLTVLVGFITGLLFWTVDQSWHIAANLSISKFYVSSLLVSLNARVELERRLNNPSTSHQGGESHGLTELGVHSTSTRNVTVGNGGEGVGGKRTKKKDLRTALGFGFEDVNVHSQPQYGRGRRNDATRSLGDGIQVVTHQTVVTDGDLQSSTYLATPSSEKSLAYYSNEKEEEGMGGQSIESEGGITPIRSAHFAVDLERR
ncbi:hypothetical protein JCM16303_005041 [Sporobolomyces ruberrimus]